MLLSFVVSAQINTFFFFVVLGSDARLFVLGNRPITERHLQSQTIITRNNYSHGYIDL